MAIETGSVSEREAPPRDVLVTKKATCPFLGSAIAIGKLQVENHAGNPLASVRDVIKLEPLSGGPLENPLHGFGNGDGDEGLSGVKVILAGLVDDPDQSVLLGPWVGQALVDLAELERGGVLGVVDTDDVESL
jgi:hypothetical protein